MSNSNSKIPSVDTKPDMIKELKEIVDSNDPLHQRCKRKEIYQKSIK
jgi:hypothetical protein